MPPKEKRSGHIRLKALACASAKVEQALKPKDPAPSAPRIAPDLEYEFTVGTRAHELSEGVVRVELRFAAAPDEDAGQPYEVEVIYFGDFELRDLPKGLTPEVFAEQNAPAILFPFLREAVASLTSRCIAGPLFVPPINIAAMLKQAKTQREKEPVKT